MKTIGILGGMSWESSREYYRLLNEAARAAKGGLHSAPILMHSFDYGLIARHIHAEEWQQLEVLLAETARKLEAGGAEAIVIATNLIHRCAGAVEAAVTIPLIHIADAIAGRIKAAGQTRVGLLGARGTMEAPFYRERLAAHGIEAIIPDKAGREVVNRIIFEELCLGRFEQPARDAYLAVMNQLAERGAQGIILGCTEIEQLIRPQDTPLALYPSAAIHAAAAAEFMLEGEPVATRLAS